VSQVGHKKVVKMLLHKGANIDAQANDGWTALHSASYYNMPHIMKVLLREGARVDLKSTGGKTAQDMAEEDPVPTRNAEARRLFNEHNA
jgi:ankyrin repeat protein